MTQGKQLVTKSTRLINICLRGATLGMRFLFVFFLAKHLDSSSVGYYGLFTATVSYALYAVGLDFYTYGSREIVNTPASQRGQLLKGQAALAGGLYLLALPVAAFLLSRSNWPGHLVWWFLPILVLEHLNQEVSRLLVVLSEQLAASVILFVRQGSWALASIVVMMFDQEARGLNMVMALWALAGVAAAAIGIWKLKQLKTNGWNLPIDWAWLKKGVAVSTAFLISTLALRGMLTLDRYWLEVLGGIETVGAYVLLMGVASTLIVFLDAAVFSFGYPALIAHNHKGEHSKAHQKVKQLLAQTLAICALFGVVSWLLLPYLLTWIGNPVYFQAAPWYLWLLSAMVLNAIGMVPHFGLYARGQDKPIIHSHIASMLIFAACTWALSRHLGPLAVPLGLNVAFLLILLWKSLAYMTLIRQRHWKYLPC
jgi:O-antigen/teichoic acid export membrane protein